MRSHRRDRAALPYEAGEHFHVGLVDHPCRVEDGPERHHRLHCNVDGVADGDDWFIRRKLGLGPELKRELVNGAPTASVLGRSRQ